jgi:hypothetical protein
MGIGTSLQDTANYGRIASANAFHPQLPIGNWIEQPPSPTKTSNNITSISSPEPPVGRLSEILAEVPAEF